MSLSLVSLVVSLSRITRAQAAAAEAASICCHALGACPEVRMSVDPAGDGLVAAVPEYVHYVVLELLKNAMRATMQAAGRGGDAAGKGETKTAGERGARNGGGGDGRGTPIVFADAPEVVISVRAHGDEDVMLVVADQGGGIPAEATDKVRFRITAVVNAPRFIFLRRVYSVVRQACVNSCCSAVHWSRFDRPEKSGAGSVVVLLAGSVWSAVVAI